MHRPPAWQVLDLNILSLMVDTAASGRADTPPSGQHQAPIEYNRAVSWDRRCCAPQWIVRTV